MIKTSNFSPMFRFIAFLLALFLRCVSGAPIRDLSLVLIFLSSPSQSFIPSHSIQTSSTATHIARGTEYTGELYPWLARIKNGYSSSVSGGGVFIQENALLTAAHIDTPSLLALARVSNEFDNFQVLKVYRHPEYHRDNENTPVSSVVVFSR
jgi:hypothetical protein